MRVTRRIRLEDLGLELEMLSEKIGEAVSESMNLERMKLAAMAFCPVDSGALLSTIRVEQRSIYQAALIAGSMNVINPKTGRPVDYARYVHDGTSKMPGRPFLLQAVLLERYNFIKEIVERTAGKL